MDQATIERLVEEHPEAYRGGRIDASRPRGVVTVAEAWDAAVRCLEDDRPARAAYWVGWAKHAET